MKEFLKKIYNKYSSWIIALLIAVIVGLVAYVNYQIDNGKKMMDEIDYVDSINQYHKYFYETKFRELKKTNKELYDSLKQYKDKIDFLVQFNHEKNYSTGVVHTSKPKDEAEKVDTLIPVEPLIAKTFEYTSEPNDTFQYKLKVNSYTEPNWYEINAKVKNKFTIVNKSEGDANHITIQPNNGGTVSDVTVWKKKEKRTFWDRFSFGPGVTAGYDVVNKQWGIMAGASATFDLK